MSSQRLNTKVEQETPRRLTTQATPPLINICVEKRDKPDDIPRIFQAACLFKQVNQAQAPQQQKRPELLHHHYLPSNQSDEYGDLESPRPQTGGFNSQIGDDYDMAPILEDESLQKDTSVLQSDENEEPTPSLCLNLQEVTQGEAQQHSASKTQLEQEKPPVEPIQMIESRNQVHIATLNLDNIIRLQMSEGKETTTSGRRNEIRKLDSPPMSSRRMKQNMPTQQELAIENKVLEICSSSVTQPIFQTIWKVILSLCFERGKLKDYMLKQNLITVQIRALHYHEILCLFRKAHGPILQIKKVDNTANPMRQKKKASLITANETVQGFASYKNFCRDVVQMLGDGVLLLTPDLYTVVVQLVFEAVSIQTKTKRNEDVIYLRRITDILSPFQTPVTDNLPVQRIFTLNTLDQVVKIFCMREISQKELARLTLKRFIPQALIIKVKDQKVQPGEQLYDQLDKVLQHSQWKENRSENMTRLENSNSSAMKKISHMSTQQSKLYSPALDSYKSEFSENASEKGSVIAYENYGSLQPKLAMRERYRESPLNIKGSQKDNSPRVHVMPLTPKIEAIKPIGPCNTQYHITIGNSVPQTPKVQVRQSFNDPEVFREESWMMLNGDNTITAQPSSTGHPILDDQFSLEQQANMFRPSIVKDRERQTVISRISRSDSNNEGGQTKREAPHKLVDLLQQNHKYRKLTAKTKQLHQHAELLELQQFGIHREMFDRLRANDLKVELSGSLRKDTSSSNVDTFNVQINSNRALVHQKQQKQGKARRNDQRPQKHNLAQPIMETKEIRDTMNAHKHTTFSETLELQADIREDIIGKETPKQQELFDLKPLLLTNGILRIHKSSNQPEFDDYLPPDDGKKAQERTLQQDHQKVSYRHRDFLNQQKTFNRQNLQQCKAKNKRVIANNQQKQNELLIQKGYQTCLFSGRRQGQQQTKSQRRRQKSHAVNIPKSPQPHVEEIIGLFPPATDRQAAQSYISGQQPANTPLFNSTEIYSRWMSPSIESSLRQDTTLDSYIMSLQINGGFPSSTTPVSRGSGAAWQGKRRASNPYSCNSRIQSMGPSANSQRQRLRSIGSPGWRPDSNEAQKRTVMLGGNVGRTAATANSGKIAAGNASIDQKGSVLGEVFCRTIPKMLREFQSRAAEKEEESPPTIPIHLHLASASIGNYQPEYSPPSIHGVMRDSLMAPSREESSQGPPQTLSRSLERDDDGICTVRAESHLDGGKNTMALENALRQASYQDENYNNQQLVLNGNRANIVLVAPMMANQSNQESKPQAQSQLDNLAPKHKTSEFVNRRKQRFTSVAVRTLESEFELNSSGKSIRKEKQSVANMICVPTNVDFLGIPDGHLSGQVELKQMEQKNNEDTNPPIPLDQSINTLGRGRVSTADQSIKKQRVQHNSIDREKRNQCYKSGLQGENITAEVVKRVVASRKKTGDAEMNFGDLGRWQMTLDDPDLIMNNSESIGMQSLEPRPQITSTDTNNKICRASQGSEINLSNSSQPQQKFIESAVIELNEKASQQHEQLYQKGEYIAPRRAITRNFQKLSIKTPINLLALHDVKAVKNINLTVCNQDLDLNQSNKHEIETMNLSQTKSIRTLDRRQRTFANVSLAARRQPRETVTTMPLRTPTPIKIVDLSASPGHGPRQFASYTQRNMTLRQEYAHFDKHFPLLNNRAGTRPLKQEIMRKVTAGMFTHPQARLGSPMSPLLDNKTNEPLSTVNYTQKTKEKAVMNQQNSAASSSINSTHLNNQQQYQQKQKVAFEQGFDLRSMVNYLVRSPVAPFSARNNKPYN